MILPRGWNTLILFFCIFGINTHYVYAQKLNSDNEEKSIYIENNWFNSVVKADHPDRQKSGNMTQPTEVFWDKLAWDNPQVNTLPDEPLMEAGDVNGDGLMDMYKILITPDERDGLFHTSTYKSLIYLGGEINNGPAQIVYYRIIPIGDIDGDGYDDAIGENVEQDGRIFFGSDSGLIENAEAKAQSLWNFFEKTRILSKIKKVDYNNDAFQDLLYVSSERKQVKIMLGAGDLSSVDTLTMEIPGSQYSLQERNTNYDLVHRGDSSYIAVILENITAEVPRYEMALFSVNNSSHLSISEVQSLVEGETIDIKSFGLGDFTADGMPDASVFIRVSESGQPSNYSYHLLEGNPADSARVFKSHLIIDNYTTDFDNVFVIYPVNDIDENGKVDLFIASQSGLAISELTNDSGSWKFRTQYRLPESSYVINESSPSTKAARYLLEGNNSISVPVSDSSGFGSLFLTMDPDAAAPWAGIDTTLITESFIKYKRTIRDRLFNLGSLERGGEQYFGIRVREYAGPNNRKNKFIVQKGLNNIERHEIPVPEGYFVRRAESGYFTHDQRKNIVVVFQPLDSHINPESLIRFYSMNDLSSPMAEYKTSDLIEGELVRHEITFGNAGDINNDGLEDLVFVVSSENGILQVIYGGNDLINKNIQKVILNENFPHLNLEERIGFGITAIQKGDDLTGDGIDDLILADSYHPISMSIATNSAKFYYGALYVVAGKDSAVVDFKPAYTMFPDTNEVNRQTWIYGLNEVAKGDFNGDGKIDLASKTYYHMNADGSGAPAIAYYLWDGGYKEQPDTTIGIKYEYLDNFNPDTYEYLRGSGRDLLHGVGDRDGDGIDELLYVPSRGYSNAVLYEANNGFSEDAEQIFESLIPNLSINSGAGYLWLQYRSLVGDFNNDGQYDFLGYHPGDANYRDTPVFLYNLGGTFTHNEEEADEIPENFRLFDNYPNPFNPVTQIKYSIPVQSNVSLEVFDLLGRKVQTIVNQVQRAGTHTKTFDAGSLSSGLYLYRLKAGDKLQVKKMMLIK